MNVWRVYMLFIWTFFCFQASTALCISMSTHANSWIKVAARQNIIWIRFGNRRAVRRWVEAGMALTAIGEIAQWGGVADCGGSRTSSMNIMISGMIINTLNTIDVMLHEHSAFGIVIMLRGMIILLSSMIILWSGMIIMWSGMIILLSGMIIMLSGIIILLSGMIIQCQAACL